MFLRGCNSLKERRHRVRPLVESLRVRLRVSACESRPTQHHRRAWIGVAAVTSSFSELEELLRKCDRLVWARDDLEVVAIRRDDVELDT